jgi:hypothetical protein
MLRWSQQTGVGWHYIAPGELQQNGFHREPEGPSA